VTLQQPGGPRDGREVSPGLAALLSIAGGAIDLTVARIYSPTASHSCGNQRISLAGLPNRRTQRLRGCDTR
jgi:hypothetical protein